MIIYNAKIDNEIKSIHIENGIITKISDNISTGDIDAKFNQVIPGLIDVHIHGCLGYDTMDGKLAPICKALAEHGTTSFLPTTMTSSYEDLYTVSQSNTDCEGANILGYHFEGPYLSKAKKGAMNELYIKNPDIEEFKTFKNVKMVTVAPETEDAMEFIKAVTPDCIVSIGHTVCDYDIAVKAIENGANCLTHTYNAMPQLLHREPGPIGAGIHKGIYAQLIGDGFHVSPAMVYATYKMFGADRVVLISDTIRPAGMPDGEYESGGLKVILKNGEARLESGTIAGGFTFLFDILKRVVSYGVPFEDALRSATQTPAKMLGINKGKIKAGFDADLLIIDDEINLLNVIIGGKVYK
ncbi:MAG: N-acetylglucosamine-6-phosphate deacetylase [Clostridia bacterium]|nr:N-acetylglucosamine-6-phosphate deacetylase [Clostridia bacterium]